MAAITTGDIVLMPIMMTLGHRRWKPSGNATSGRAGLPRVQCARRDEASHEGVN